MKGYVHNIGSLVTLERASKKKGKNIQEEDLSIIQNASFVIENGKITSLNPSKAPTDCKKIDANGNVVLPGFIDAHTHLVFAGNRAHEFQMRAQGKTYQEIHKTGGGILFTVEKTREASEEELFLQALTHLKQMKLSGTTTVEIKSGYGLTLKDELKILKVVKKLQKEKILTIIPTFLGAHTIPMEYKSNPQKYVDLICYEMIPKIAEEKLAVFCDIFIEEGSFSVSDASKIFEVAHKRGLKIRAHVEQFTNSKGAQTALEFGATSVDHLEKIDSKTIEKLGKSEATATLLPGVSFFLGTPYAPARELLNHGVRVALASDFNPGSCMSYNLPLIATIAITQTKMTLAEALVGITLNGAYSLGLEKKTGSLEVGKRADFMILNSELFQMPFYHFGANHIKNCYSHLNF